MLLFDDFGVGSKSTKSVNCSICSEKFDAKATKCATESMVCVCGWVGGGGCCVGYYFCLG